MDSAVQSGGEWVGNDSGSAWGAALSQLELLEAASFRSSSAGPLLVAARAGCQPTKVGEEAAAGVAPAAALRCACLVLCDMFCLSSCHHSGHGVGRGWSGVVVLLSQQGAGQEAG